MKLSNRLFIISTLMLIFLVISCSKNEISSDKLQERNGIYYEVNKEKPYSGKVIATYDNEQRRFEKEYKNGLLDGLSAKWYSNGQKQYDQQYADGRLNGLSLEWYNNGQNKSEISYKAGQQSGTYKNWHENGQQTAEGSYKNNKKNGKWTSWYSNGQKEYAKEYVDGKLNSLASEWFSNGEKKSEIFYIAGQQSGTYKTWYENGQQTADGSYKDNKKDGKWVYWYSNGQKDKEGEYQSGKRINNWIFWALSGEKFGIMKDIDGNTYKTIKIGNQVWMAENLKVTRYRNSNPIPNVTNKSKWKYLKTGAYCHYDNNSKNASIYGKLYNWYAVNDKRKIAPKGWHIPTDQEWEELEIYLGANASGKLKERGTGYWQSPNENATNASGYTALPGGYRLYHGTFGHISAIGYWWSSTVSNYRDRARGRSLAYGSSSSGVNGNNDRMLNGFSVRCIRD